MRSVGSLIREGRSNKGFSVEELEAQTHIKASFINAIEEGDWERLPHFNIVVGFVKSIAHYLDIDENQTLSLLRREYPPVLKQEKPKTKESGKLGRDELNKKFRWGPRFTFIAGIAIILLVVLGYLGFQYRKFNLPPNLTVNQPTEGQVVNDINLVVSGKTDTDAIVTINNQSAIIDENGNFNTTIDVSKNTNIIEVKAESRSGKVTIIKRKIDFKP